MICLRKLASLCSGHCPSALFTADFAERDAPGSRTVFAPAGCLIVLDMAILTYPRMKKENRRRLTAKHIGAMRDRFEMVGIDTGWVAAEMIQFEPLRDRSLD